MPALYIFPDANLLLHFRRIDELDWRALAEADEIVLVLAPIVVRELEKAKDQPQHRSARQRARDLSSWLRELRRSGTNTLANGARLEIATREPSAYFADDLDPDIPDDRLIASVNSYKANGHEAAIATDDTILLFKLDAHGVRAIEPTEDLRRKDEPDPLERANAQLKQKVDALAGRKPKLELAWADSATSASVIRLARLDVFGIDRPDQIRATHTRMLLKGEGGPYDKLFAFRAAVIPEDLIRRYNEELGKYLAEYDAYYAKCERMADELRRSLKLRLLLGNGGSGSATHVLARLSLPTGITPLEEISQPKLPDAPRPPEPPKPFGLETSPALDFETVMRRFTRESHSEPLPLPEPEAPSIDLDSRTVTWQATKIIHDRRGKLAPLACSIEKSLIGTTVAIPFQLHAEEMDRPISSALRLEISEI